jgi:hypothetical protein
MPYPDCNIQTINVDNGTAIYAYDMVGDLLSEAYSANPAYRDVNYTYMHNGNLMSIKKNGIETAYSYDSRNRTVGEIVIVDSLHIIPISYSYDSNGQLIRMLSMNMDINYSYNSGGNLQRKTVVKLEDGRRYSGWTEYIYDGNDNIIKAEDSEGREINYNYSTQNYSCLQCADSNCTSFVNSTCHYQEFESQSAGNTLIINQRDSNSNIIGQYSNVNENPLVYNEQYDGDGLLTQDTFFEYRYNSDSQLLKISPLSEDIPDEATFEYYSDGLLKKRIYSDGEFEEIEQDPLGRDAKLTYNYHLGSTIIMPPIVSIFLPLKNAITGFVLSITGRQTASSSLGYGVMEFYATNPGDTESYVSDQEFQQLSANMAPELRQVLDDYNRMIDARSICLDHDGNMTFDDSLFEVSYLEMNGEYNLDSCETNKAVREYYCGLPVYLFGGKVAKSAVKDCTFGCENGACLISPTANITIDTCSNSKWNPENGELGVDCGGNCTNQDCCLNGYRDINLGEEDIDCGGECLPCSNKTFELPPEPTKPSPV